MHLLIFLGIILGIVGWFTLSIKIFGEFEAGFMFGIMIPIALGVLAALGWGLWSLT